MNKCLREKLMRLIGQPVIIYTDDKRRYKGTVIEVSEDSVEIIDKKCGKLILIELFRIVSILEPQMEIPECDRDHECDEDEDDFDRDFDRDRDEDDCRCRD